MSFSIKQIRYFVAAAETGQISRAAAELNVTQSAVTIAIRQLEDQLGLELLKRSSTGVAVTQDGEQVLRLGRDILASMEQVRHVKRTQAHETSGEIRLGVTYTVAGYFLPRLLLRFKRIYPDINVRLFEYTRPTLQQALADGRLDLALGMFQGEDLVDGLDAIVLHRSRRRLWLHVGHRLLREPSVTMSDVEKEPYIALTIDGTWNNAQRYWAAMGKSPNVVFETSSVEAVRTMVACGMGVTILADMIYRSWSLDGQRIETRDLVSGVPTVDVTVLTPRTRELSPAALAFSIFLQRSYSGN